MIEQKVHYEALNDDGCLPGVPLCGHGRSMRRSRAAFVEAVERVTCTTCRHMLAEIWIEAFGPDNANDPDCAAVRLAWLEWDADHGNLWAAGQLEYRSD